MTYSLHLWSLPILWLGNFTIHFHGIEFNRLHTSSETFGSQINQAGVEVHQSELNKISID